MSGVDGSRRWALPVAAVAGVAVVVGAVLLFGAGADTGCACQPRPAVAVDQPSDGETVTVTWTSGVDAERLVVTVSASNGSVSLAGTEGNATATEQGVRLSAIGAAATFAREDPGMGPVDLRVVARYADGRQVIVREEQVPL